MNRLQTTDRIVTEAGALRFSSEVPAAKIKGLQDRLLIIHWLMKENRFSGEFLFLGTKFNGVCIPWILR